MGKNNYINSNQQEIFGRVSEGGLIEKLNPHSTEEIIKNLEYNPKLIPRNVKEYIDNNPKEYRGLMGPVILVELGIEDSKFIREHFYDKYMKQFHEKTFNGDKEIEENIMKYILKEVVYKKSETELEHYQRLGELEVKGIEPSPEELHDRPVNRSIRKEEVHKKNKEYKPDLSWRKIKNLGGDD